MPTIDATLRLRDGRTLGYLEVGNGVGPPIFHFHGHGSSRLDVRLIAEQVAPLGVRLIGLDRPGVGRSSARPGARILDWSDDVVDAADRLGIQRLAVEGISGGGPYALARADKIPDRVTACGLISWVPPGFFVRKAGPRGMRLTWLALERLPLWVIRSFIRLSMRKIASSNEADLEKYLLRSAAQLGAADQRLLGRPELRKVFAQAVVESYRLVLQRDVRRIWYARRRVSRKDAVS